jgi:hypothetical protein
LAGEEHRFTIYSRVTTAVVELLLYTGMPSVGGSDAPMGSGRFQCRNDPAAIVEKFSDMQISLHKSNIEQQHRPILDQPPAGLDLR